MTSPVSVIVFDLDDTLYPERAFAFSGYAAVAAAYPELFGDCARATVEMRELFDTGYRGRVFNEMLSRRGKPDDAEVVTRMIRTYHTHRPEIAMYPDAESALVRLRGRFRLGLITDGPAAMQSAKIEALSLRSKMDEVILTDELGPEFGKPHPRAFEEMAQRFGTDPSSCAYIADNASKDFVAPNALGWLSVQVRRSEGVYRDHVPAEGGAPTHVVTTLDELGRCLNA